jgi:hypothetical protein
LFDELYTNIGEVLAQHDIVNTPGVTRGHQTSSIAA